MWFLWFPAYKNHIFCESAIRSKAKQGKQYEIAVALILSINVNIYSC